MRGVHTLIKVNLCSATKCLGTESALAVACATKCLGTESALAVACPVELLLGGAIVFEKFTRTKKILELIMILLDRDNYY